MKTTGTIFLLIVLLFLLPAAAPAAPFLISDAYGPCGAAGQTACPVAAVIYADGVVIADDVALQADLSISYDLVTRPDAETVYTATYKDALGDHSGPSNPYLLLVKPAPPKNLGGSSTP